ncbi:transcriptional regulator, RpiR family [Coriobacterium glomerans PW2]|uniref:Transcriptional regulator, RpiR family n=1 Tax=Coriobacterium glomerans (strain ATCC 49209 / DSM 20642 / JCM 10262 / PW2) TaxID=700015 RepID=F2NBC5_CORGP|nr:MurR/RpiR family transcriptional regulator [Coriobacterium glomerans]AEB06661.1 transcriptional regulator, RpiR family [Coriobacterium glomerans PW2]
MSASVLEDMKEKIKALSLTKTESAIADYVLDNFDSLAFLTVSDLAAHTNTSDASIIRFIRRLGFAGYMEYRQKLQDDFMDRQAQGLMPSQKLHSEKQGLDSDDLADALVQKTTENLFKTFNDTALDQVAFTDVCSLLANSTRIFVAGFRGSHCCSMYAAHRLGMMRERVTLLSNAGATAIEQLVDCKRGDLLLIFSFARYSRICRVLLEIASGAGVHTVLVTDKLSCPFANFAKNIFTAEVVSLGFANSYIAPLCLAEALLLGAEREIGAHAMPRLEVIDGYLEDADLY